MYDGKQLTRWLLIENGSEEVIECHKLKEFHIAV